MKSFPPPLSVAEEARYLQQYTEGDLQAKHQLIERNMRLVAHILKKYQLTGEEQEELLSIGTIGLVKAVNTFDPYKNTRLTTYAARCIENEILMYLRSKKKTTGECSLYEPIGTDKEGNEIRLFDIIESPDKTACDQVILKGDIALLYEQLKASLSDRERLVLKLRYGLYGGEEYTQREVASQLGISRSYVSRIEKGAIEKLRGVFST